MRDAGDNGIFCYRSLLPQSRPRQYWQCIGRRHPGCLKPYRDYSRGAIASALDPIIIVISTWTVSLATIVNGCGFARRDADSPLFTSKMELPGCVGAR